jgi:hypothetical protein
VKDMGWRKMGLKEVKLKKHILQTLIIFYTILYSQVENFKNTRDLLLQKVISGEIDVGV